MKQIIKLAGYVLVLLLLGYVAVLYNSIALLVITVVLFLLPSLEFILLVIQRRRITVTVTQTEEELTNGDSCHLWLTVTNSTPFPLLLLTLDFQEQGGQQEELTLTLDAKESRQQELSFVMEHCGIRTIRFCQGWLQDYMGWFRLPLSKLHLENRVVIYPKERTQLLTRQAAAPNQDTQEEGESTKRGQSKDQFLGVRPYASGDSLKHIHWKVSARQGDLFVREYSEDIRAMHLILLDVPALTALSVQEQEHAYEMLMTLSCSLLMAECSHYIAMLYFKRHNNTPFVKQFCVTQRQELRTSFYALYELVEECAGIQESEAATGAKPTWTKTQQLSIYNQHYNAFPPECVSHIPEW